MFLTPKEKILDWLPEGSSSWRLNVERARNLEKHVDAVKEFMVAYIRNSEVRKSQEMIEEMTHQFGEKCDDDDFSFANISNKIRCSASGHLRLLFCVENKC